MQFEQKKKGNKGIFIVAGAAVLAVVVVVLSFLGVFGGGSTVMSYEKLRCMSSQDVTPFGNQILYYDNDTLHCLSSTGNEKWSYTLGEGAGFSAGKDHLVAWVGNQLFIFDKNGRSTYNDHLTDEIQFARVGSRYVAAVVGSDISPKLIIKDLDGLDVDSSSDYTDMLILDVGFFSDGEFLWITAVDVYGTVPNSKLYTIRVGQMNTGEISLGEPLVYDVVYSGGQLNVVDTRHLTKYDYRGTKDEKGTVLVYGWHLIDAVSTSGDAQLLFATSMQTSSPMRKITTLRLLNGKLDERLTLPASCVGAALYRNKVYAFSEDSVYRAPFRERHFTTMKLPMNAKVTDYLGMLSNGTVLLASGSDVYAVKLP